MAWSFGFIAAMVFLAMERMIAKREATRGLETSGLPISLEEFQRLAYPLLQARPFATRSNPRQSRHYRHPVIQAARRRYRLRGAAYLAATAFVIVVLPRLL